MYHDSLIFLSHIEKAPEFFWRNSPGNVSFSDV